MSSPKERLNYLKEFVQPYLNEIKQLEEDILNSKKSNFQSIKIMPQKQFTNKYIQWSEINGKKYYFYEDNYRARNYIIWVQLNSRDVYSKGTADAIFFLDSEGKAKHIGSISDTEYSNGFYYDENNIPYRYCAGQKNIRYRDGTYGKMSFVPCFEI